MLESVHVGLVTVSDRAASGSYTDRSGPAMREWLKLALTVPWQEHYRLIPDETAEIERVLIELCDKIGCCLVVTTGGTGPARRDVTPEATAAVCHKILPGFGELMRQVSLKSVPTAILSRQTAGIRGRSLIVNLPGKPAAIEECLQAIFPAVAYCIDLIEGPYLQTDPEFVESFRPQTATKAFRS